MNDHSTVFYEDKLEFDGLHIGYSLYGSGPKFMLCICGAVGCYKKDWPLSLLEYFDQTLVTIVCIDPPGYGTSRPPDRAQEKLGLTPFTVVGWSEGARTAIHVAGQGGETKVNKLILLAAASKVTKLGALAFFGSLIWSP
uniref:AB hydrolase-1 domain-containing protein n=1 Tax=Angiostrongylus cantonensis TaxID=6313 RepID=A0A0K0DPH7_ANGCA